MSEPRKSNGAPCVLAIDPGQDKCGVAVLAEDGVIIDQRVLSPTAVSEFIRRETAEREIQAIVLGNGTRSRDMANQLKQEGIPNHLIHLLDETNTTIEGRLRFFAHHPPRGWRRFIPRGLLTPEREYDDFAAIILAERYLSRHRQA